MRDGMRRAPTPTDSGSRPSLAVSDLARGGKQLELSLQLAATPSVPNTAHPSNTATTVPAVADPTTGSPPSGPRVFSRMKGDALC